MHSDSYNTSHRATSTRNMHKLWVVTWSMLHVVCYCTPFHLLSLLFFVTLPPPLLSPLFQYLSFACGLLTGALSNVGIKCQVTAEVTSMPACKTLLSTYIYYVPHSLYMTDCAQWRRCMYILSLSLIYRCFPSQSTVITEHTMVVLSHCISYSRMPCCVLSRYNDL